MIEEKGLKNLFSRNEELFHELKVLFILLSITLLLFIANSFVTQSVTNSADSSQLKDFLTGVTITDIDGNSLKDETLYVGEQYKVELPKDFSLKEMIKEILHIKSLKYSK